MISLEAEPGQLIALESVEGGWAAQPRPRLDRVSLYTLALPIALVSPHMGCVKTSHAPHSRALIVRRAKQDTCSCKQCENLVAPLSGGAALEEAAAWEAKQMEAARHAKELLLAEVERLSAARAKGKKGKKKKKNVGVGDTGAARLNEEMLCS